jgi:anaerobic magnesium-protoporphyrin IX monomethyl ester cyclase
MIGRSTLLINPPLVGGVAFTRQGRCQERQETLGTTKPPYSLAVLAALLRQQDRAFRLIDQTGERVTTEAVIERLERDGFEPTLIVFCSTVPTLQADVVEMAKLKRRYNAPLVCFGPHASCAPIESMGRAPEVDAMIVGEPEDAVLALADLASLDEADRVPSVVFRREGGLVPHRVRGTFTGFPDMPFPAWDLLPLKGYRLPLVTRPYLLIETSRGCPYTCDFCVVPYFHGHKFRERSAKNLVDDIERGHRELGIEYFYLWGDTVTLNAKSFSQFCDELIARRLDVKWFANARADNLQDPAFLERLKRSGCWMLSMGVESGSDDTRRDMMKRLEHQKIGIAFDNLRRAGIKSFGFFIYGYPGDTLESMEKTTRYAIELDADFANFYPAVPYPGTAMYEKCRRDGLLTTDDWTRMEYSYYILRGGDLDEKTVMQALNRARRRFFLRPSYLARHLGEILRIAVTDQRLVFELGWRMLFGRAAVDVGTATSRGHEAGVGSAGR